MFLLSPKGLPRGAGGGESFNSGLSKASQDSDESYVDIPTLLAASKVASRFPTTGYHGVEVGGILAFPSVSDPSCSPPFPPHSFSGLFSSGRRGREKTGSLCSGKRFQIPPPLSLRPCFCTRNCNSHGRILLGESESTGSHHRKAPPNELTGI